MSFSFRNIIYSSLFLAAAFIQVGCVRSVATNPVPGAFEYREIYLPSSNPDDLRRLGLNSVDDDWGLWGHNLANILPEKASMSVYARHDGIVDRHQFCFSGEKLYGYIRDYIENNYSHTDSVYFAILPNDNDIVCECSECIKLGNTPGDASPAVLHLIKRLCRKFPNHTFFTSYYATTASIPDEPLPANAGVLVSAIGYPLNSRPTPGEEKFSALLEQWQQKSDNVYVWDYINNFDDYFTPFPVFNVMQQRLRMYRDMGVKGVFLNGSGTDFSTFSHLHKVVLARMLIDPDIDWRSELRSAAREYYPKAGDDIADYIIAQEEFAASTGRTLPLYEGVKKALDTHLQSEPTRKLYADIVRHIPGATPAEKERLEMLRSALSLTILELNRIEGSLEGTEELLQNLEEFPRQQIEYYNEAYWPIAKYIGDYSRMFADYQATDSINVLKGVRLKALNPLDEDYNDIGILTDGLIGIPSNYHNGNLICSADPSLTIEVPRRPGMKTIKVWLAYNPAYHIGLPAELVFSVGGRQIYSTPRKVTRDTGHSVVEFRVPEVRGDIRIRFIKDPEVRSFAIEEIQALNSY